MISLRALVVLFLLAVGACSKDMAATMPSSSSDPPPKSAQRKPMAEWKPGDIVTARGKISTLMSQHMTQDVPGKKLGYFDVEGENPQICVYWKEPPKCPHLIEVTGTVIELRGHSKKPGEQPSKVDETYSERHIDVESVRCVE